VLLLIRSHTSGRNIVLYLFRKGQIRTGELQDCLPLLDIKCGGLAAAGRDDMGLLDEARLFCALPRKRNVTLVWRREYCRCARSLGTPWDMPVFMPESRRSSNLIG